MVAMTLGRDVAGGNCSPSQSEYAGSSGLIEFSSNAIKGSANDTVAGRTRLLCCALRRSCSIPGWTLDVRGLVLRTVVGRIRLGRGLPRVHDRLCTVLYGLRGFVCTGLWSCVLRYFIELLRPLWRSVLLALRDELRLQSLWNWLRVCVWDGMRHEL